MLLSAGPCPPCHSHTSAARVWKPGACDLCFVWRTQDALGQGHSGWKSLPCVDHVLIVALRDVEMKDWPLMSVCRLGEGSGRGRGNPILARAQASAPSHQGEKERPTRVYLLGYLKEVLGLLCAWKFPRPSVYQNQDVGPGETAQW